MIKIWTEAFWKPLPDKTSKGQDGAAVEVPQKLTLLVVPIVVMALMTVILGIAAEPVFSLSLQAAEQLADPLGYISAVLGG
jgi:multicomponent Na+:H+ antiporter subunit D